MSSPERGAAAWRRRAAALAVLLCAALATPACVLAQEAAAGVSAPAAAAAQRARITQIVQSLRADPDLRSTQTIPILRWKDTQEQKPAAPDSSALTRFLQWLTRATRWLAEAGRWSVWLLGALAVAVLLVSLRYWLRERADPMPQDGALLPSRVGTLDVRPESLPPDIGAAARALWLGGEHRPALSLLYRGALSRLIHEHAVPIRAAHTEPECLRLALRGLDAEGGAYFARLVAVWQRAVYGGRDPETPGVLALCEEFSGALGLRPAVIRAQPAPAAP